MAQNQNMRYLSIDVSDLLNKFNLIERTLLNETLMSKIMHDTCVDTAKYVKTILARKLPDQYAVKQKWVRSGVMKHQDHSVAGAINSINVAVPLKGARGVLGETFTSRGKPGRPKRGYRKISAKVLKGTWSRLPKKMEHQGDNPPFVAPNKIIYTRREKHKAYPIVRVPGLGLPQMPLKRSKDEVRAAIIERMDVRFDHHIHRYLSI